MLPRSLRAMGQIEHDTAHGWTFLQDRADQFAQSAAHIHQYSNIPEGIRGKYLWNRRTCHGSHGLVDQARILRFRDHFEAFLTEPRDFVSRLARADRLDEFTPSGLYHSTFE